MRIAILTSSRADFGIYLPLIKAMKADPFFKVEIIAFGTHLSFFHGHTIDQIQDEGFEANYRIETVLAGDSPSAIATSVGLTSIKFAEFWNIHQSDFDIVFCLGDRYEMFGAVTSGVPFQVTFAHLHGGEETQGAIDNVYRNSITQACKYHFVSCEAHAQRVSELIRSSQNVYNVGSLSIDNVQSLMLYSTREFLIKFGMDLSKPTILVTVHPETVAYEINNQIAVETANALLSLNAFQVLITLPNADTNGSIIRNRFLKLPDESSGRIMCFENLGSKGYFSAMKHCSFLLGNTSSGIIEAASFSKCVINLGNRQLGRQQNGNIINSPFDTISILEIVNKIKHSLNFNGDNIYYKSNVAHNICSILKGLA